jgi:hypothetical protein
MNRLVCKQALFGRVQDDEQVVRVGLHLGYSVAFDAVVDGEWMEIEGRVSHADVPGEQVFLRFAADQ